MGIVSRLAGLALCCLLLAAAFPGAARAKQTITLCFERQDVLPWRTVTGAGLNFALLKLVEARLDIQFDYQSVPWKRCLEQLKANEVGGAFAVSFKPDRLALGAFPGGERVDDSKRMHIDRYMLIRRKGSAADWDGKVFHHIDGAIGVQLGYSVGDFLRAQKVVVDDGSQRASELVQKLLAGRIAAAALGGSDAANALNGPFKEQLEMLPAPLLEKPYFLLLSHALVDANPQLAKRIWQAVEDARNSPAYKKILRDAGEGASH